MHLSTFAVVIGVLSCLSYIFLSGLVIAGLVYFDQHVKEHGKAPSLVFDGSMLAILTISLIFYVIMFALSVLMIVGVKKKRHEWIGPWIILSAVDIACSIVYFFVRGFHRPHGDIILSLVYIAISCLVWYPVYTLWIVMRNANAGNVPQSRPETQTPQYNPMAAYTIEVAKQGEFQPQLQKV